MKTDHTQRGSVSLMVAFLLPVLIGLAALAIDLVYLQVVRNEMQNDADAAALAGAGYFFDGTNATPNWTLASQKAQTVITRNTADGAALTTGTVATGYWNLVDTPKVLQALPMVPKAYDAPAIQVTVAKAASTNGGEVPTFFARYWGIVSRPMQATAVAGTSEKALAFTKMWANVDIAASDTLVETAVTSNTFTTQTTNSKDSVYIIDVDADTLDVANGFDCLRVDGTGHAATASRGCVVLYNLYGARYSGISPLVD